MQLSVDKIISKKKNHERVCLLNYSISYQSNSIIARTSQIRPTLLPTVTPTPRRNSKNTRRATKKSQFGFRRPRRRTSVRPPDTLTPHAAGDRRRHATARWSAVTRALGVCGGAGSRDCWRRPKLGRPGGRGALPPQPRQSIRGIRCRRTRTPPPAAARHSQSS